jgi:hypothetical protein
VLRAGLKEKNKIKTIMDNYANINDVGTANPSGFTNNWLEARDNRNLFNGNYRDFDTTSLGGTSKAFRDVLNKRIERSETSDMFFGDLNVKHLKWLICKRVHQESGGKYQLTPESQSDEVLLTVMQSIFLENAHYTGPVTTQVAELNYLILIDMVPRVIQNAQLYLTYQRDAQQPLPLDRSVNMSSAGTKSVYNSKTFL